MWKNYMLAALNVAVAGLPFLVGWDLVLYGVYCGFAVLLLGLGSVKEFSQNGLQALA